ncbi:Sortilin-related receptor [Eumeta japonica]|uniref:Sortilin-related receptor n=1 Tax=Eumeta variegata TaxID=151549 RepID=A0A4C1UAN8_EUMVA|nr:Sortilin-related receptor [Eumeta japonica]
MEIFDRLSVCPVAYWTDISIPLVAAGIVWLYDPKIRHGTSENTLYVAENSVNSNKLSIINKEDYENPTTNDRRKREATMLSSEQKNISTWITHLNDSHQQLMVHWVGEGSNVIICLARDTSPRTKGSVAPSALFISYDYGKNFTNKTEHFRLSDEPDSGYAQLDKFFNHPKYPEFCVFVDSTNKKIYYTNDNGQHIHRSDLSFHPSDLAFDDDVPDKFIVLDRVDSNRKLYLTMDGGKSFKHIQSFVKTFFWSSGNGYPKMFYVERWKPDRTSTILSVNDPINLMHTGRVLFEDAKDFQIKGDFMFATKQSKEILAFVLVPPKLDLSEAGTRLGFYNKFFHLKDEETDIMPTRAKLRVQS